MDDFDPTDYLPPEIQRAARVAALRGQPMPQSQPPAELLLMSNPMTAQMGQQALQYNHQQMQYQQALQRLSEMSAYHQGRNENYSQALDIKRDAEDRKADRGVVVHGANGESVMADPNSGQVRAQITAPHARMGVPKAAGGGAGFDKQLDKWEKDFDARMSASGARAGALGTDYVRLQNAQNLRSILQQPVNTPQMVAEATAALGKLITGGILHESTMEQMMPQTAGMDLQRKVQYFLGNPRDAGVGQFLQYMGHTADREEQNALARMKMERMSRATAFEQYFKAHPDSMARQAARYGLSPDEVGGLFAPAASKTATPQSIGGKPTIDLEGPADPKAKLTARISALKASGVTDPKAIRAQLIKEGLVQATPNG